MTDENGQIILILSDEILHFGSRYILNTSDGKLAIVPFEDDSVITMTENDESYYLESKTIYFGVN